MPVLIFFQALSPVMANPGDPADLEGFVDEFMQAQMQSLHIPNAAVTVVRDGEVLLLKGYGFADLERQTSVDAQGTLFRPGSVGKLFTWTAVMQLVEQGQLDLDADVNQYLDFPLPARVLSAPGAEPAPITLRHLMTHTAGFEHYHDAIFRLSADDLLPLDAHLRAHLPARVFPPGEVMAYSNYGAALAGYIVQRVSGQPFAEYVEQHIFAPLGMNHSSFRQPLPPALAGSLAQASRFVDGAYLRGDFEYMQEPEGSLSSTAADMARFMLAHLAGDDHGTAILSADSLRQMHTLQFSHDPRLGGMTLGFMEGRFNGQRTLFHGGSTALYDSGLYLLPEANLGIFVAYSGANHLVHTALFQAFLDRYYPAAAPAEPAPTAASLERSRPLTGEYHPNSRSFTTDEALTVLALGVVQVEAGEDGSLLVTLNGETNRFVETDPGVYHNQRQGRTQDYFGPFQTLIFSSDPFGRTLLTSDGPMTYSKAPWYATSSFTIAALLISLLVMLASLLFWSAQAIFRLVKRLVARGRPAAAAAQAPVRLIAAARLIAGAFAILALGFFVGVLANGMPLPVYNLPPAAFGILPGWAPLHDMIPALMALTGAALLILTGLAWWKGALRLPARIHYTFFTAFALLLLWIFSYWNIL